VARSSDVEGCAWYGTPECRAHSLRLATPSRAVGRKRVIRDCDPPQRRSDGDGSDEGQNYHRRKPSGHPLRHYGEFTYSAVTGRVGLALDLRAQRLASIRLD
jgi:hypothetical protein